VISRVLSLMFLCMGSSSWALAAAIWSEVHTSGGKVGLWLLLIAGLGGAMASFFNITHEIGHAIAGFLGVIGFPIAAVLLSVALGRNENWRAARTRLLCVANLSRSGGPHRWAETVKWALRLRPK
jgi:hypothetical protein